VGGVGGHRSREDCGRRCCRRGLTRSPGDYAIVIAAASITMRRAPNDLVDNDVGHVPTVATASVCRANAPSHDGKKANGIGRSLVGR
jgi:hypothetical protein